MSETVFQGRSVSPGHPSLPGHFPSRPVVPGVLLLDEVVAAIAEWQQRPFVPSGFPSVKFLQPLLPGEIFSIRLQGDGLRFEFECATEGRILLRGTVTAANAAGGGKP